MVISMLKIKRPLGRLIFNMGIAIPGKTVFLIETAPCSLLGSHNVPSPVHWLVRSLHTCTHPGGIIKAVPRSHNKAVTTHTKHKHWIFDHHFISIYQHKQLHDRSFCLTWSGPLNVFHGLGHIMVWVTLFSLIIILNIFRSIFSK